MRLKAPLLLKVPPLLDRALQLCGIPALLQLPGALCWRALGSRVGDTGTEPALVSPEEPPCRGAGWGWQLPWAARLAGVAELVAELHSRECHGSGQELVFISSFPGF